MQIVISSDFADFILRVKFPSFGFGEIEKYNPATGSEISVTTLKGEDMAEQPFESVIIIW